MKEIQAHFLPMGKIPDQTDFDKLVREDYATQLCLGICQRRGLSHEQTLLVMLLSKADVARHFMTEFAKLRAMVEEE